MSGNDNSLIRVETSFQKSASVIEEPEDLQLSLREYLDFGKEVTLYIPPNCNINSGNFRSNFLL